MKSSSYQLVMSAMFNGIKGDRPPTATPTSIACHDLMDITGVSFPEAHINSNAMAELALGGYEIIGFDTVMPEYSVDQEVAALGAVIGVPLGYVRVRDNGVRKPLIVMEAAGDTDQVIAALGRLARPEECAEVIAFLASEESSGVNGEAITVALGGTW